MLSIVFDRSLKDPNEEIDVSFTHAYEVTLKPHHGMLIRPIFSVFSFFFPSIFKLWIYLEKKSLYQNIVGIESNSLS